MMEFLVSHDSSHIIKVIGVGGGGSNAVNHMFEQGITGVDFIVCNTDSQALALSPVPVRMQLGPNLTEGRGAGSIPDVGKEACLESVEDIQRLLENNTKMLFITAGMGGGTGTGAAPIIAKVARELGILTVGIVTIPFQFEGKRRQTQAMHGLEQLKKNVDTLIVITNERLREIYGDLGLRDAFSHADDILTTAARAIAEIITVPGYINVDFADVNTVMRDSGVAIMGVGIAEGSDRARQAIDLAMSSPLLEDNNIQGAQHILLNISSGTREVTMDEIMMITDYVPGEAGEGTDVIWGNCYNEALGDKLSVTLIATGFTSKGAPDRISKGGRQVHILDDDARTNFTTQEHSSLQDITANTLENTSGRTTDWETAVRPTRPVANTQPVNPTAMTRYQPGGAPVKLSSPKIISDLENEPAFARRGIKLDDETPSTDETRSRISVNDNDEPDLFNTLPYLHDKGSVD
ncbi:MAG: cell division protein FtsZ [Saprospiraceae bacterium]